MTEANTVAVPAGIKWEYNILTRKSDNALMTELNALGQEYWETISVLYYKDVKGIMCWTAFLKRPSMGQVPRAGQPRDGLTAAPGRSVGEAVVSPEGFDLSDEDFKLESE